MADEYDNDLFCESTYRISIFKAYEESHKLNKDNVNGLTDLKPGCLFKLMSFTIENIRRPMILNKNSKMGGIFFEFYRRVRVFHEQGANRTRPSEDGR